VLRAPRQFGRDRTGFHMLAVAHGLAQHRREWPKWFHPEDIGTQEPDQPEELPCSGAGWDL
jgi:hypothetical protein